MTRQAISAARVPGPGRSCIQRECRRPGRERIRAESDDGVGGRGDDGEGQADGVALVLDAPEHVGHRDVTSFRVGTADGVLLRFARVGRPDDPRVAAKLKDALEYCLSLETGRGQALSEELGYIPLPDEALIKARKAASEIQAD